MTTDTKASTTSSDGSRTQLASGFTVADYRQAVTNEDSALIAEAIRRRFMERYISPVMESTAKHGFALMAIACLTIESLESFRQGWKTSDGHEKEAFRLFFAGEAAFADFIGYEEYFFRNVRCGILHQGETYQGWKTSRSGVLFDANTRTINAEVFLRKVNDAVNSFCDELKRSDWRSDEWRKVNKRMVALCEHCRL